MKDREPCIWHNGRFLPASEPCISAFDHGLTTGDGVFEAVISYGGVPFQLERHWRRLQASGRAMGLRVPELEVLAAGVREILKRNSILDGRIRITVTGGVAPLGSEKGAGDETVVIATAPLPVRPPVAKVISVPWTRNEHGALAGVKSTSYAENVVALAYAKARGGQEAIFGNTRGELCEGTGSNIFVADGGHLLTPPLNSGCLAGVTRAVVLDLCAEIGQAVEERTVPLTILNDCQEAFLVSTFREVQPIGDIDGRLLAPTPGKITARLQEAFRNFVRKIQAEG